MAKSAKWSRPKPANDETIDRIPYKKGSYEIGYNRRQNDRKHFKKLYIGSSNVSMRNRVRAHLNGTGNNAVKKYLRTHERNNLYVRYKAGDTGAEAVRLEKYDYGPGSGSYAWNNRQETARRKRRKRKR